MRVRLGYPATQDQTWWQLNWPMVVMAAILLVIAGVLAAGYVRKRRAEVREGRYSDEPREPGYVGRGTFP